MGRSKNTPEKESQQNLMIRQEVASKFIHRLAHDITGIVHNIIGFATLLEDEHDPEYIKGITKQAVKLRERMQQAVASVDEGTLSDSEPD